MTYVAASVALDRLPQDVAVFLALAALVGGTRLVAVTGRLTPIPIPPTGNSYRPTATGEGGAPDKAPR